MDYPAATSIHHHHQRYSPWRLHQPPLLHTIFLTHGRTNPFYTTTMGLCAATSAVSLLLDIKLTLAHAGGNRFAIQDAQADQHQLSDHCTTSHANIKSGRYYTLITSLFNHTSLAHFMGNALGLYTTGRLLKPIPFIILFYGGGVLGNLLCLALDDTRIGRSLVGRDRSSSTSGTSSNEATISSGSRREQVRSSSTMGSYVGASGGVAALMAFMSCCFPHATVTMYVPGVPLTLPFWMHTLGFAVYSSWAQLTGSDADVAHLGHLGGLVWGVAYFIARFRRLPWIGIGAIST